MRSVTGLCMFVDRIDFLKKLTVSLPRLANDVDILIIQKEVRGVDRTVFKDMKVRRHIVQAALEWLLPQISLCTALQCCTILSFTKTYETITKTFRWKSL